MSKPLSSLLGAALILAVATPAAPAQTSVGFDAGAQGWSINGLANITPTGGNPDHHVRYPNPVDTFGIAARNSTHPAFLGDYGAKGDVTLSIDFKVEFIQFFFSPVPRELVVILHDDDNVSGGPASVWTSLGVLDGNGMPWTTFSADLVDPTSTTIPAGWHGAGAEDPQTFEPILPPGATWANVLASVDRIEFTTYVPGFFYGFTNFDVSIDNVSISPLGGADPWTDLGNALAGVNGDPALAGSGDLTGGSPNALELTNAAPSAVAALFVGFSTISAPFKGGTLVPDPALTLNAGTDATGALTVPFIMPGGIPGGVSLFLQAAIADAAAVQGVALSNALEGVTP